MRSLLLSLALVALAAIACSAATPPTISETFDSNVNVFVTLPEHPTADGSGKIERQNSGKGRFMHRVSFFQSAFSLWTIDNYDAGVGWHIEDGQHCQKKQLEGSLLPYWSWLQHASYNGTVACGSGQTCDVWRQEGAHGFALEVRVLSSNPQRPMERSLFSPHENITQQFTEWTSSVNNTDFSEPAVCKDGAADEAVHDDDLDELLGDDEEDWLLGSCSWAHRAECAAVIVGCAAACCGGGCVVDPACIGCMGGLFATCSPCF